MLTTTRISGQPWKHQLSASNVNENASVIEFFPCSSVRCVHPWGSAAPVHLCGCLHLNITACGQLVAPASDGRKAQPPATGNAFNRHFLAVTGLDRHSIRESHKLTASPHLRHDTNAADVPTLVYASRDQESTDTPQRRKTSGLAQRPSCSGRGLSDLYEKMIGKGASASEAHRGKIVGSPRTIGKAAR